MNVPSLPEILLKKLFHILPAFVGASPSMTVRQAAENRLECWDEFNLSTQQAEAGACLLSSGPAWLLYIVSSRPDRLTGVESKEQE